MSVKTKVHFNNTYSWYYQKYSKSIATTSDDAYKLMNFEIAFKEITSNLIYEFENKLKNDFSLHMINSGFASNFYTDPISF